MLTALASKGQADGMSWGSEKSVWWVSPHPVPFLCPSTPGPVPGSRLPTSPIQTSETAFISQGGVSLWRRLLPRLGAGFMASLCLLLTLPLWLWAEGWPQPVHLNPSLPSLPHCSVQPWLLRAAEEMATKRYFQWHWACILDEKNKRAKCWGFLKKAFPAS